MLRDFERFDAGRQNSECASGDNLMLLKHDGLFVPCDSDGGDEMFPVGIFVFNITRMTAHLHTTERSTEVVTVSEFHPGHSTINEPHVDTVDLKRPVIVAEISPGRYNLIDGHHRMEKARRVELNTLPAYRLHAHEHLQFLTTRRAYDAYIDYWNDKVEEQQ